MGSQAGFQCLSIAFLAEAGDSNATWRGAANIIRRTRWCLNADATRGVKKEEQRPKFAQTGMLSAVFYATRELNAQRCFILNLGHRWRIRMFKTDLLPNCKRSRIFIPQLILLPVWGFRNPHIGSDCWLIQSDIPIPAAANRWCFRGSKQKENKPSTIYLVNWTVLYIGRKIPSWCPQVMSVCPEAWDTITLIIILACIATNVISGHKIILLFGIIYFF